MSHCAAYANDMEMNDTIISEGLDISEAACAEQSSTFFECPIQVIPFRFRLYSYFRGPFRGRTIE